MIRLTSIQYQFDNSTAKTDSITCSFNVTSDRNEYINGNVTLLPGDLEESTTLDDLTRKQIETLAKTRFAKLMQGEGGEG
ncbi:hypothetical protein [Ligilactobacillus agilis]|uniref:hypothetical protein n=1 Tax=Ligilactobacillus agilis TaxID=1601 RepID=UPI003F8AE1D4